MCRKVVKRAGRKPSERRVFMGTKNFGYYATFGSTHRDITYREFEGNWRIIAEASITSKLLMRG
jgi:hypothetical protein